MGKELEGIPYEPLFDFFKETATHKLTWTVLCDEYYIIFYFVI